MAISHYQNLPQGWAECTLEDVGSWSSGATPSRSNKMYYANGTVNWLKTGDLNDSYIDYIPEKITELALKECSVRLNPKDSVLIAMYGATIGKIGILNIPSTTNQACCACVTHSGIHNKFLFYLLMSKKRTLQMKAEGGAQPNISKEKIINFPILLPPAKELKRSSCDRRSYEEPVVLMHCWDTYGFCALNWMFLMALSGIAREEYKRIWQ